jgi:AcrR family transcriptional regulator
VTERDVSADPRERLLHAALAVFAESGFRGATTRRIAEAADVNEVTLFRIFGSKKALLEQAVELSQSSVAGVADAYLPEEPRDVEAELTAWARVHWKAMRERRGVIRKMMSEVEENPHMHACLSDGWKRTHGALEHYLQRLQARGEIDDRVTINTAVAMLSGVLFADAMGRDIKKGAFPAERTAVSEYITLFLRALSYTPQSAVTDSSTH